MHTISGGTFIIIIIIIFIIIVNVIINISEAD